jgi:hypothetical protein
MYIHIFLFLCFINDLPNATNLDSRLFADDTACTHSHSHLPTLIDYANTEIQKLANWFRSNKMAVNISKTKYIIFHGKGKKVNLTNLSVVYNDNDYRQTINNQLIIHSSPDILYKDKDKYKNHGILKIEEFWVSNDKWKNNKKSYYTHVCFPENWLLMD